MSAGAPLYRPPARFDLLRLPLIGRALRGRHGRLWLQVPFFLAAALLIYEGFTGRQEAAYNLTTLVPWVHYRGLIIVALLLAGNLFCMGCPFTLPRTLAKRLAGRGRRFPRVLRNKWLAIAGLFALFFAYEYLDMWSSPALTAWVIVAYFLASFVLELVFKESPFCKYVCPLGSFNFVYSTVAPTQIGVHDATICKTCVGKECINGSYSSAPIILIDQIAADGSPTATHTHDRRGTLGCGTELFAPQMKSNMDCTLCLDCARACPHSNVGLFTRAPGAELSRADAFPQRYDMAFLVIGLAFMGLVNAFGMVPPVYALMNAMARGLGLTALGWSDAALEAVTLVIIFGIGGIVAPIGLSLAAGALTRRLTRTRETLRETVSAFAPAFVPLGFGLWAAHYGFHFLIGVWAIVPAFQYFLVDHGIDLLGAPDWSLTGVEDLGVIGLLQGVALLTGFAGSMMLAQRTALRRYRQAGMAGLLPWALLLLAMMLVGFYIFSLPMEMRGTVLFD